MSERDYEVLTVDYAVAAAQAFGSMHQQGHAPGKFVFSYVSGEGADQEEKAWTMFGRVKVHLMGNASYFGVTALLLTLASFRPHSPFRAALSAA